MSSKMQVSMKLDQRLTMNQQLRQAITLLQYNTLDLKQFVQQFIETNPLIEIEEREAENHPEENENYSSYDYEQKQPDFAKYSANYTRTSNAYDDENALENCAIPKSLRSLLLEQTLLCQFDEIEQIVAELIVDAIDEKGYLTMSLEEIQRTIVDVAAPSLELMQNVLKKIQTFEPTGIASRNLRECLLIQIDYLADKNAAWELARKIVDEFFDTISSNNTKKMIKQLGVTTQEYMDAMELIRTLNPNPGGQYSTDSDNNIEPELYVKKIKNEWRVFLTESVLTNIKINNQYKELIKENKRHGSYPSLKRELEEAQWLLKGLKRRNETLLNVGSYIMEMQQDFLEHGHTYMKPMNIIDVAQALNLHESTVSRVTTGKYIATPRGVYELKFFFPSHVSTQTGDECSATAVKAHIKEIIEHENGEHVYSDSEIAEILQKKGINIARRTVSKYRESLNILSSYQRQMQSTQEVETE